ncbi:hypothetical protein BKA93DRAFT_747581 [Sparassis latifolia]|uniref:Uncharacterized protein n=1 Tax=Sparassis crispa TaxID=139825 RepID=A0A401H2A4_9APHY|nr:hypothetical protein SCP_1303060 [Sparassis crispa]GBE88490.1 hypothetical protein SCP_1303060 [Sparassis crispa]
MTNKVLTRWETGLVAADNQKYGSVVQLTAATLRTQVGAVLSMHAPAAGNTQEPTYPLAQDFEAISNTGDLEAVIESQGGNVVGLEFNVLQNSIAHPVEFPLHTMDGDIQLAQLGDIAATIA